MGVSAQIVGDAFKFSEYLRLSVSLSFPPFLFALAIGAVFHLVINVFCNLRIPVFSPAGAGFLSSYFSLIGGSLSVFPVIITLVISGFLVRGYKIDGVRVRDSLLEYKVFGAVFALVFVVCSNYYDRAYQQNGSIDSEQDQ